MSYRLEYFPESFIALSQELSNHPELCRLLSKYPPNEFEMRLGEIAAYCDVALDGDYTQDDLSGLCELLWKRLRAKNCPIILPQ